MMSLYRDETATALEKILAIADLASVITWEALEEEAKQEASRTEESIYVLGDDRNGDDNIVAAFTDYEKAEKYSCMTGGAESYITHLSVNPETPEWFNPGEKFTGLNSKASIEGTQKQSTLFRRERKCLISTLTYLAVPHHPTYLMEAAPGLLGKKLGSLTF